MTKNKNNKKTINYTIGDFEYKMSKELADSLLKGRKGEEKKKHPKEFLCSVVNEQFGIKGNCANVIVG